jgi:DNA polymerase III subunit delta
MANCFVFHGIEEFLRARAISDLGVQLGDPSLVSMNSTFLDGSKLTLAGLMDATEALPFLAEKRLVVVSGLLNRLAGKAGKPNKAEQQFMTGLLAYLPSMSPSAWLVFDDEPINEAHPALRYAREHPEQVRVQMFGRLGEAALRTWLVQRAKEKGGALGPDALDALATVGDVDLRLLDQEISKLVAYAGGRNVTGGDIQKLVHAARSVDVFAMVDALGQRNGRRAIEQFHALVDDGQPPVRLLMMITRQFRMIMQAKDLSERRAPIADVMRALGAQKFVAEKMISQSRLFHMVQLETIYRWLLETDLNIKTGQCEALLAVDIVIAEIAARPAPSARASRVPLAHSQGQ